MDYFNLLMKILAIVSAGFMLVFVISMISIRLKPSIKPFFYQIFLGSSFGLTTLLTMYMATFLIDLPGLDAKYYLVAITAVLAGPISALIPFVFVLLFSSFLPLPMYSLPLVISTGAVAILIGWSLSSYVKKKIYSPRLGRHHVCFLDFGNILFPF